MNIRGHQYRAVCSWLFGCRWIHFTVKQDARAPVTEYFVNEWLFTSLWAQSCQQLIRSDHRTYSTFYYYSLLKLLEASWWWLAERLWTSLSTIIIHKALILALSRVVSKPFGIAIQVTLTNGIQLGLKPDPIWIGLVAFTYRRMQLLATYLSAICEQTFKRQFQWLLGLPYPGYSSNISTIMQEII